LGGGGSCASAAAPTISRQGTGLQPGSNTWKLVELRV